MRISDWSSDVCSSDLSLAASSPRGVFRSPLQPVRSTHAHGRPTRRVLSASHRRCAPASTNGSASLSRDPRPAPVARACRSEEHTSELQSLMRISYAVFCLKKIITSTPVCCTHQQNIAQTILQPQVY